MGGEGGDPRDVFGSELWAKRDFFESIKDAGIFWGLEKKLRDFLGYCIFYLLKSMITQVQFAAYIVYL